MVRRTRSKAKFPSLRAAQLDVARREGFSSFDAAEFVRPGKSTRKSYSFNVRGVMPTGASPGSALMVIGGVVLIGGLLIPGVGGLLVPLAGGVIFALGFLSGL